MLESLKKLHEGWQTLYREGLLQLLRERHLMDDYHSIYSAVLS